MKKYISEITDSKVLEIIKPPFHYDDYGQIIFDSNNILVLNVRAWGVFQYYEKGEELQDSFGKMIANALNKEFGK